MAKNNFNFQASLRLNSSGFKKGVKSVQNSLNSLKKSFLTFASSLGAGLGFGALVSNLKATSVELSSARNALQNVSKVTKTFTDGVNKMDVAVDNYADNLKFVRQLAKTYSQDMLVLTNNLAQFTGACNKTNLSLENQRLIFESLTKASAFYALSAEQSKNLMNAVTQMVSKGKVSAEELRNQMGNVLPGAFNIMASAIGVSAQELDSMMKKGEVLAEDALPKFAAMLDSITNGANFDNLQSSLNNFKNTWYELVEKSGAENMFKGMVDAGTKAMSKVTGWFSWLKGGLVGLGAMLGGKAIWKKLERNGEEWIKNLEKSIEKLKNQYIKISGDGLDFRNDGVFPKINADSLKERISFGVADKEELKKAGDLIASAEKLNKLYAERVRLQAKLLKNERQKDLYLMTASVYEDAAERCKKLGKELGVVGDKSGDVGKELEKISKAEAGFKSFGETINGIGKSIKANAWMIAITAAVTALSALMGKIVEIRKELKRIKNIVSDYEKSVRNVSMAAEFQIFKDDTKSIEERQEALDSIVNTIDSLGTKKLDINEMLGDDGRLDETKEDFKELDKAFEDWLDRAADAGVISSMKSIDNQMNILQMDTERLAGSEEDRAKAEEKANAKRLKALEDINKALGRTDNDKFKLSDMLDDEGKFNSALQGFQDLKKAVDDWTEALKTNALMQVQLDAYSKAQAKINELRYNSGLDEKEMDEMIAKGNQNNWKGVLQGFNLFDNFKIIGKKFKLDKAAAEIAQLETVSKRAEDALEALGVKLYDIGDAAGSGSGDTGGDGKAKGIAKVYEDYVKDLKELQNQLKEGAKTQDEYNKAFNDLVKKAFEEAAATGQVSLKSVLEKLDNGSTLTDIEKWYADLADKAKKAVMRELADKMVDEAIDGIDDEIKKADDLFQKYLDDLDDKYKAKWDAESALSMDKVPKMKKRDDLFDYSKEKSDILGEQFGQVDDYKNQIQEYIRLLNEVKKKKEELKEDTALVTAELEKWQGTLQKATAGAKNLEDAMNLAKINEDIESMKENIASLTYGGIKNMASSLESCVKGWESIRDAMDDDDTTGFEMLMLYFNEFTQIIDTVIGIIDTIKQITEISDKLGNAELAQQQLLNDELRTTLALKTAIKAVDGGSTEDKEKMGDIDRKNAEASKMSAAASLASSAANVTEAATSKTAASAKSQEAIADATKSGAKLPFPANLVAIASAVAAVVGALSMMSKFAKGGIVGGNKTLGDNNVVRANSGEMILTKGQQGTLYKAIRNGSLGNSGGEWKVRGTDLIKVIENTKMKQKG